MKPPASYVNMKVWKWLFVVLMLVCFLLGSAYYSIDNAYVLHVDAANKDNMISPVKVNNVGDKYLFRLNHNKKMKSSLNILSRSTGQPETDNVRGYWNRIQENVSGYARKRHTNLLNPNVGNGNTNVYISENIKDKQAGNSATFMKSFSNRRSKERDKSPTFTNQFGKVTTSFPSTTSAVNMNVETKQIDTDDVHSANERIDEKDATARKTRVVTSYRAGTDRRLKNLIQHTNTLDGTTNLRTNKDYRGKIGHRMPAAKFKRLPGHRRTYLQHRRTFDIPVGPDTEYAIQDLESLRINKTHNSTFVLLVTYARSGSTWLGEITNQANQTFYVYEPLQRFVVQGYYKENLVCFNNNTCRKPRMFSETHNFAITTLYRLFTCQFTKLHPRAVNNLKRNLKSLQYAETYRRCLDISGSTKKCLQGLENVCLNTTHRILKTIRISMELVNKMMDLWPHLKIVHLVRDPRGITNSRLGSRTFAMAKQLVPHSSDMCNRLYEDVQIDTVLNKKYVNRLKLVFYESLAEMPLAGAKFIYNFLDIKLTKYVINWVYNSTHANEKSGYFGTMRSDSMKSANRWRTRLTLFKIKIIDNICRDVYKTLGFMTFNTSIDLYNSSVPSRRSVKNLNWFS